MDQRRIELLAPARDLDCGRAAVVCGADAVYIGAPRFGARDAAGNPIEDIAALTDYGHRYWARIYVTLNTILHDAELPEALRLVEALHGIGVDGLIVQDMGLLECDLPPIPLIASTQTHNASPERVAFLEQVGFRRVILARELDLGQIRAIRAAAPSVELEAFIHGALCVCYSGQCYLSYALGGRSGNRGQCAQPCRKEYTLVDAGGQELDWGHLLSLRDLNLSDHIGPLLDAGITSFKIEGRLKDRAYVANVVAHYRDRLDREMEARGLRRSSSGRSDPGFSADVDKTFNRGYTAYFLEGGKRRVGSPDTPKMVGEPVGRVASVQRGTVVLDRAAALHPGDGLCFFDAQRRLCGTVVNAAGADTFVPDRIEGLQPGVEVFRNRDHAFLRSLERARPERRIGVSLSLSGDAERLVLRAVDEDGVEAEVRMEQAFSPARKPDSARDAMGRQLGKTGGTGFACLEVRVDLEPVPFVPVAALNALRRDAIEALVKARAARRPRRVERIIPNAVPYPKREATYRANVLNRRAEAFYRRHGVERIEWAAESGLDLHGRIVMTTRHCIKHQLGLCPPPKDGAESEEPWHLIDEEGHRLELTFDCRRCGMDLTLRPPRNPV